MIPAGAFFAFVGKTTGLTRSSLHATHLPMLLLVSGATTTVERLKGHPNLGHLVSPRSRNSTDWFRRTGMPFAADNGAFSGFDAPAFLAMLDRITGTDCHFVVCPDVVGNARETLGLFGQWRESIAARQLPVAYVAQDGQEDNPVPWDEMDCLFIGGSTEFKLGKTAESLTREAKARGRQTHMDRVNTAGRLRLAHAWGCSSVDGTGFSWFPEVKIPPALERLEAMDAQGWLW